VKDQLAAARDPAMAPAVHETEARRADGRRFSARLWVRGLLLDGEQYLLITVTTSAAGPPGPGACLLRSHDQLTGLLNRQEFRTRLATIASSAPPGARDAGPFRASPPPSRDAGRFATSTWTSSSSSTAPVARRQGTSSCSRWHASSRPNWPRPSCDQAGGDEFAALLRSRNLDAAIDLCEGLMQTVAASSSLGKTAPSTSRPVSDGALGPTGRVPGRCPRPGRNGLSARQARRRNRIHVYREGEAELIRLRGDMHLVSTINQH